MQALSYHSNRKLTRGIIHNEKQKLSAAIANRLLTTNSKLATAATYFARLAINVKKIWEVCSLSTLV
jgi:hypothetical protein